MKTTLAKTIGTAALAILMTVIFAHIRVSAQEISDLEGSWNATVTFRNCQTGAALGPSFPAMDTFMQGGTMQEFGVASGFLRSQAHGVWSRHVNGRYFLSDYQFFRFNADNTPNGRVVVRKQIYVTLGFYYTATARTEFYDNNGNLVGQGCATETATRFQ